MVTPRDRSDRSTHPAPLGDPASSKPAEITLTDVLRSASELQRHVPGAVLVGGSAAAYHAGHRFSVDHDHVLADLADRFETILNHLESLGDWSTARAKPGKIILGSLGGIESGVRQMIRTQPLETERVIIDAEHDLIVPTAAEALRIKAWLAINRNQTRDYLDIAALADHLGLERAADILNHLDAYYDDPVGTDQMVTQIARQLADPQPRDSRVLDELPRYKQLAERWHTWDAVTTVLAELASLMLVSGEGAP